MVICCSILFKFFFVKGLECNEQRFEILEGLCVNPAVPGALPNWFGAPAYKLLPPTEDLFKARFYEAENQKKKKMKIIIWR